MSGLCEMLKAQIESEIVEHPEPAPHHEFSVDWPEPCPVCGATDDFDGGMRCNACHTPWPPEM